MRSITFTLAAGLISLPSAGAEPKPFTEGEIRLRIISGRQETELRYRLKDGQLRIDRPGEIIPAPPVNLLDLATGTLRILRPHNSTWLEVPADALRPARPAPPHAGPTPPAGIGPPRGPGISPPRHRPDDLSGPPPGDSGPSKPQIGPSVPRVSPIPEIPGHQPAPALPMDLPPGIGPLFGGGVGGTVRAPPIPPIPGIPGGVIPLPGMFHDGPLELKRTGEKRILHGYECVKYTIAIPREGEMTLWLAGPGLFPPLHFLRAEVSRPQHRPDWDERIAALLREESLFPLLAELKGEGGNELARWEVIRMEPGDVEDPDSRLFKVPDPFTELFSFHHPRR